MQAPRFALAGLMLIGLSAIASAAPAPQGCELAACPGTTITQQHAYIQLAQGHARCRAKYNQYQACLRRNCARLKRNSRQYEYCAAHCQSPWEACENGQ